MKSWPNVKLGEVQVGSNIAQNPSYLVIICHNAHEKLTKCEIRSSSKQFEHWTSRLENLRIAHLAHRKSYQFTWKVDQKWNYVKFKSGSNIAQNHSSSP